MTGNRKREDDEARERGEGERREKREGAKELTGFVFEYLNFQERVNFCSAKHSQLECQVDALACVNHNVIVCSLLLSSSLLL